MTKPFLIIRLRKHTERKREKYICMTRRRRIILDGRISFKFYDYFYCLLFLLNEFLHSNTRSCWFLLRKKSIDHIAFRQNKDQREREKSFPSYYWNIEKDKREYERTWSIAQTWNTLKVIAQRVIPLDLCVRREIEFYFYSFVITRLLVR